MNLMHIIPTDNSLHHHEHEACTQYITEYAGMQLMFAERNDYFLLVASEKIFSRKQHLS